MAFATKFFIDYPADRFSVNANANADAFGTSIIYETMVANAQHVQALLDLDRSKLTFSQKLERIAKILGLLENEHSSSGEVTALVGKEEWALRWLLSKLNQISGEGVRARGEVQAWILVRQLILRLPLATAARLLHSSKLPLLLDKALDEARSLSKTLLPSGQGQLPTTDAQNDANDATKRDLSYRPKKRKRSRSLGLDPENQKKPASWEELQNLVAALLLLLTSLVQRTKGWQLPKQSQQTEYARQYLKSVLRSEPAHAAATVGRWLHVLSIIHGNNAISPPQAIFKERPGLDAIIDVWENRLRRGEDKDEGKDAVIFATHCLCPALLLLNECDTESNFQVREDIIVAPLEQMLARQIILPGRTSFFGTAHEAAKAKPMVPSTEQASILHALLTPLRTDLALLLNDLPSTSGKRTEQPAQGLIALFKIAIRCSPSKVRREQGIDTQWLEALLLALAEVAEIHVAAPGSQRLTRAEVEFLIALLDASNERCIPLQTATVQRIVARYGGLFGEADEVEWSLCETAIRLNSNVFLVPIEVDTILPGSQRSKMTLAEPLLSEICSVDGACDEATREGHAPIQQMIFLPLMTAFAHARDLLGFLRQWHRGLAQLERRRSQLADQRLRKGRSVIALVEDDQVVGRLRTVLEISVTPTQIADFLEQMLSHLRVGTAAKVPPSNEASASAIVVDAVLQSIRRDEFRDAVADTVKFIYRTSLKHLIARAWPKHQRWRLWRILATIIEGWPHLSLDEDADELKTVATQAQELLAGVVADVKGGKDAKKCREAFCAFQFVLSNLSALTPTRGLKGHTLTTFGDMLANLETYLNLPAVHQQDDSTAKSPQDILVDSIWDGSVGHLMTAGSLGVALLALLFLQFPRVLLFAPSSTRQGLIRLAFSLARAAPSPLNGHESNVFGWTWIWHGVLSSEVIVNHATLREDLVGVLLSPFTLGERGEDSPMEARKLDAVAIDSALRLPLEMYQRAQREAVLDRFVHECHNLEEMNSSNLCRWLALCIKLMQVPNSSSEFAMTPATLWRCAHALRARGLNSTEDELSMFAELVQLILRHLVTTSNQARSAEYLDHLRRSLSLSLGKPDSLMSDLFSLSVIKSSVSVLLDSVDRHAQPEKKDWLTLRHLYVRQLVLDLEILCGRPGVPRVSNPNALSAILDALTAVPFLCSGDAAGFLALAQVLNVIDHLEAAQGHDELPNAIFTPTQLLSLYKILSTTGRVEPTAVLRGIVSLLYEALSLRDRTKAATMFTELCGGLGDEQQSEVLSLLAGGDFGRASEDDQLMLVRKIIPSIKGPSEHFSQPREVLSKLISHLCQQLVECRSIRRFRVVADCVEALLLKQPWAVSQFNVESVLSSVVGIGCATGPNISPDHGGVMFQRLCRLLGALLAVHRLKLKGRSHLVVQVMQAMLRLLFVPNRGVLQQRAGPASARPPWLRGKGAGLGVAEGVAYTRVLSSLCDPTVSAVANKSQRSKQPLTPATDRARRGMGQHLPYLLMEYAQCQLHSRLLPDVKNTLRPGLYAIFDIADQATLRMVNASMDASSRAIFKTLADDYRRFGRWDQG